MRTFPQRLARVSHMGWNELRTRAGQEIHKRLDLALYRCGLQPAKAYYAGRSTAGRFFFSPSDLPNILRLLRQYLPEQVEEIIREADEIHQHRFRLLGYENLDYGSDIDWHLDPVHGKRAPRKPWFKIDFLDFNEVGDHKVTWELNRHQHLVTLAKAWCLTEDERYANELLAQWYSWQRANPYPMGINWSSSLEVAFRALSWLWLLFLLEPCSSLPINFQKDLVSALALCGRHVHRYLSTYFSPNTHLLGEAVALFFIGTLCPQIPAAAKWRNAGWQILLREAQRQVRLDGVYFEQSLYYHVYALDFLLSARMLAARNNMPVPGDFDLVLGRMLEVLRALSQAGPPHSFGDDDGGRVFNGRRNLAEHLSDPLSSGAVLYQLAALKPVAKLTEESLWLFGEQASSYLNDGSPGVAELSSTGFQSGGIYVMANSDPWSQQLIIDAGPQGTGRSGHGHADALSVNTSIGGRRWLIDPGTYSYVGKERDAFRGTAAHNTLRVDAEDQAIADGPFAWSRLPRIAAEGWLTGKTFSLFVGSHAGYQRLPDPVLHRRFVFHLYGDFWLVRDVVEGQQSHLLEFFWHFAPDLDIRNLESCFVATPSQVDPSVPPTQFAVLPEEGSAFRSEVRSAFVSPVYGRKVPARVVCSSGHVRLPSDHATLLLPIPASSQHPGKFLKITSESRTESNPAAAYRYQANRTANYMIFACMENRNWSFGPWSSDASFLCLGLEGGQLVHLILCHGSKLNLDGKSIIDHSSKVQRFEWLEKDGLRQVLTSDETAVFTEDALKSSIPVP